MAKPSTAKAYKEEPFANTTWICKRCKFQGTTTDNANGPVPPIDSGCSSRSGNHNWIIDQKPTTAWECNYCSFYGESPESPLTQGCPSATNNNVHYWTQVAPVPLPPPGKKNAPKKKLVAKKDHPFFAKTTWICKKCQFQGQTQNDPATDIPIPPSTNGCYPANANNTHNWILNPNPTPYNSQTEWICGTCGFYGIDDVDVDGPPNQGCPGPIAAPNLTRHKWQ